jgi:glycosyltransferase involved in cell wall biosynthesis
MRIGLDARMIDFTGIGVTIRGLLDNWEPPKLAQVTLFTPPGWKNPYPCASAAVPEKIYGLAQHLTYARRLGREKLDLFHMPHFDVPYFYRGPFVATVHDMIHVLFPEHSTRPFSRAYAGFQIRQVVRRAARLITVSESTRADLERFYPGAAKKTTVLHPAAGAAFRPLPPQDVETALARHRLARGYLLYVGNIRGIKNSLRLINAYGSLRKSTPDLPPLVMVGKNTYRQFDIGFPEGIRHLGPVPFGDLPALYNGASVFVFPSLYEGFGLPPLEAMACGTPVIVSKAASLPEVCGDAAVYVDPMSEDSIAGAIRDLVMSPSRREELSRRGLARAQKFSWRSFAEGTWNVYEQALGS